jgi:hypothetical protein
MPSVDHIRRSVEGSFRFDHAAQIIHARTTLDPAETEDSSDTNNEKMVDMMLVVLGLVFFALLLVSCLWVLRRARQRRMQGEMLPSYYDAKRNHRGLTIETTHNGRASVLVIGRDGQPMLRSPNSPPHSPDNVPEIHITFPDEHDDHGQRKSGRVLVVRVGDHATVGLEPMQHYEQLPAYEKEAKGQFYSLDMNEIGGLKEKNRSTFQ